MTEEVSTIHGTINTLPHRNNPTYTAVTDPNGNSTLYKFSDNGPGTEQTEVDSLNGAYSIPTYSGQCQGQPVAPNLVKSVVTTYLATGGENVLNLTSAVQIPQTVTTILPTGQTAQTTYNYDYTQSWTDTNWEWVGDQDVTQNYTTGSVLSQTNSDYGQCAPGPILQQTQTRYMWQDNPSYFTANFLAQPENTCIPATGQSSCTPSSGDTAAYTTYGYDPTTGNQTSVSRWIGGSQYATSHTAYNGQGMPSTTTDANGNTTTYNYDSTGLFLSSVVQPTTNGVQHIDSYTFDPNTGEMTSHTDQNHILSEYQYNDPLGRLTLVDSAVGASQAERKTTYSYPSQTEIDVAADQTVTGDGNLKSSTFTDQLGRTIRTVGPNGSVVETAYDGVGQVCAQSNPTFNDPGNLSCNASLNPAPVASTDGITYYTYDGLGRKIEQLEPDSSALLWCYDGLGNASVPSCPANQSSQELRFLGEFVGRGWKPLPAHQRLARPAHQRCRARCRGDGLSIRRKQ